MQACSGVAVERRNRREKPIHYIMVPVIDCGPVMKKNWGRDHSGGVWGSCCYPTQGGEGEGLELDEGVVKGFLRLGQSFCHEGVAHP